MVTLKPGSESEWGLGAVVGVVLGSVCWGGFAMGLCAVPALQQQGPQWAVVLGAVGKGHSASMGVAKFSCGPAFCGSRHLDGHEEVLFTRA